jgi:AraC-like DNA-binding protein
MIEYALRFDIKKISKDTCSTTVTDEANQILDLLSTSANQLFHNQLDIESYFEKGFQEAFSKKPGYYISVKQAIMDIIIATARLSFVSEMVAYSFPDRSRDVKQIERLTHYIKEHISDHISNSTLSHYLHMSERQLHRLVKMHIGLSPHHYVTQVRINYVIELMDQQIYSLKTISEMTGFSSEFHLSSTFKKHQHISPTEYLQLSKDNYKIVSDKDFSK